MPALEALLRSAHRIVAVYTQPDRPAGRGQQVAASAVKQCALRHGVPIEQPATLKDPAAIERLKQRSADLMVVAAYGLLLPQSVLDTPRLGCMTPTRSCHVQSSHLRAHMSPVAANEKVGHGAAA